MANIVNPDPVALDVQRVRDAVARETTLPGETFKLDRADPEGRITGYVVRDAFRGMKTTDRYGWLMDFFEREFGGDAKEISLVFAFDPDEFQIWQEDATAP